MGEESHGGPEQEKDVHTEDNLVLMSKPKQGEEASAEEGCRGDGLKAQPLEEGILAGGQPA